MNNSLNNHLWWEIEHYFTVKELEVYNEKEELLRLLSLAFSQGYNEGCKDTRDLDYRC